MDNLPQQIKALRELAGKADLPLRGAENKWNLAQLPWRGAEGIEAIGGNSVGLAVPPVMGWCTRGSDIRPLIIAAVNLVLPMADRIEQLEVENEGLKQAAQGVVSEWKHGFDNQRLTAALRDLDKALKDPTDDAC